MMKKILLPILLAVALLAGCGANQEAGQSNHSGSNLNMEINGTMSFEEDLSNVAGVDYLADGQSKSIVLKDPKGLTWELFIPVGALLDPQKITMSSMKTINSDLGEISSGVILKPDGLQFRSPVTLSVKWGDEGKSGVLLSGDGNGEKLQLSIIQRNQDTVEMKLFHFSTAYAASSQETIENLADMAKEQRSAAEKAAKKLLKQPIEVPEPPSISLKCHHETESRDEALIKQFIEAVGKPEMDTVMALLTAARSTQLITGNLPDDKFELELRLLGRLMKKANMLIDQYRGNEDMYMAVSRAALEAESKYQLLVGSGSETTCLPKLSAWAKEIAKKYLKELVENHEYKNIHPIHKIAREGSLLGSNMDRFLNEELRSALCFKVESINKINEGRDWGFAYEVNAVVEIDLLKNPMLKIAEGIGEASYTAFQVNDLDDGEGILENMKETFPVRFLIEDFYPCESNIFYISVDCFGAQNETFTLIPDEPEIPPVTKSVNVVQSASEQGFQEYKQDSVFRFPVELRNGQEVVAEKTFEVDKENVAIQYTLKLIHTPK